MVPFHIGEKRFSSDGFTLAQLAGKLARQAVKKSGKNVKIAGSIPPLFGSYRADLIESNRVKEIAEPLIHGLEPYVDFWLCETQSSICEPQYIKPLLPDNHPLWVSFTLQDEEPTPEPRLRSEETVKAAIEAMIKLDVQAILFNCCQPEVIEAALNVTRETLAKLLRIQIIVKRYE